MKQIFYVIILAGLSVLACDKDECIIPNSVYGFWSVESIIEDEIIIDRDYPEDTIEISFQPLGVIYGNSYRNEIISHFKLYDNDSIWIRTTGGTEAGATTFERAFRNVMPKVTFLDFKNHNNLILYTSDRRSHISLLKYE